MLLEEFWRFISFSGGFIGVPCTLFSTKWFPNHFWMFIFLIYWSLSKDIVWGLLGLRPFSNDVDLYFFKKNSKLMYLGFKLFHPRCAKEQTLQAKTHQAIHRELLGCLAERMWFLSKEGPKNSNLYSVVHIVIWSVYLKALLVLSI